MKKTALGLIFCCVAGASQAQIAFSNFGPSDTFDTSIGWTLSGPGSFAGPQQFASQFTSGASGSLAYIKVATFYVAGGNNLTLELLNDDGSDQLGSSITSWSFPNPASGTNGVAYSMTNAIPSITLSSGTKYWVKMTSSDNDGWSAWNENNIGDNRRNAFSTDGGNTWGYLTDSPGPAFEVGLNPVPEPATIACLGLGAIGILRRRRRA